MKKLSVKKPKLPHPPKASMAKASAPRVRKKRRFNVGKALST